MKTIILGKNSYLSNNLKKSITNSHVYSLTDKKLSELNLTNCNIIINSFYSSLKLEKIDSYENFLKRSLYDLSIFLDKIKGVKIRKIIYSSSSSIYNSINDYDFKDERNRKMYSSTKYNAENLIKNFCITNKINLCITRIFNIFGGSEQFSVISKIIDSFKNQNNTLKLINNGNSIRDFVHIKEVINIYKKIIQNNKNGIVDIGSGYGTKINEVINCLGKKNFTLKNIRKDEAQSSIGYNLIIRLNENNSLENYIKLKLKLTKKPKFKRFFSKKRNFIQDYLQGSIIYGAGAAGQRLLKDYKENQINHISYFVDDDQKIINKKEIDGVKIISFNELKLLSKLKTINNIIIAIPSLSKIKQNLLISKLNPITLSISILNQSFIGEKKYLNLSDVPENIMSEIFSRKVKSNFHLIKNLKNKTVLITGAGGSIGEELIKQLLIYDAKVIALDHSELALYNLEKNIKSYLKRKKIKIILGSILDKRILNNIQKFEKIDIIFHAAAYKHVNLLEKNISLAIENNIFGTQNILEVFNKHNQQIIIISTDKAARPKSILGATKRISEIISQDYKNYSSNKLKIKIVRFGNVFGSQGSAVELFIDQLNKNIPITLTHNKLKRYFISIQKVCNLVLDITRLRENDQIFILDMGKQILVKDIIYKLASLKNISESQIKIHTIGLKKGEKISEKLPTNKKLSKTKNTEIFLLKERGYDSKLINNFIIKLKKSVYKKDDLYLKKLIFSFLSKEK